MPLHLQEYVKQEESSNWRTRLQEVAGSTYCAYILHIEVHETCIIHFSSDML